MMKSVLAVAIATLPIMVWLLMGTRYFDAVPFLCASLLVTAACITLLAAAFWPSRGGPSR